MLLFASSVWAGPDYTSSFTGAEIDTGITKTGHLIVTGAIDLDGIEAGADVTDATNVTAAGAVMDSEFTAVDEVMIGTGTGTHGQVTLGASELLGKKASGVTTNLSATEVRTILSVEENADVTDATNVNSAGAVMESDFTQDGGIIVGTGVGATAEETGATLRTSIGCDATGTDNSTNVTLDASTTTGGMSITGQAISNRAATSAQTGYATNVHILAIETNSGKDTNVPTTLEVGTVGINTVAITSDGGTDDITLPAATISTAGMLTTAKWDEIAANTTATTIARAYSEAKIADNTTATVIRATNQWQAVAANVVTGLQNGCTYEAGLLGEIASTSGTGTVATINDIAHGLSVGDIISINATTSYNDIYEVNTVPNVDSFTILDTDTTNDTGYWQKGANLIIGVDATGVYKGSWMACGTSAANSNIFEFAAYVNTTRAAASTTKRKFSSSDCGSSTASELVTLAAGDIVSFMTRNITATANITFGSFTLNIHKID